jgi:glutamine synthetase
MVNNQFIPAAVEYAGKLAGSIGAIKTALGKNAKTTSQESILSDISDKIEQAKSGVDALTSDLAAAEKIDDVEAKAKAYCHKVKPHFETIRSAVDALEGRVEDGLWPVPKYREMLFII